MKLTRSRSYSGSVVERSSAPPQVIVIALNRTVMQKPRRYPHRMLIKTSILSAFVVLSVLTFMYALSGIPYDVEFSNIKALDSHGPRIKLRSRYSALQDKSNHVPNDSLHNDEVFAVTRQAGHPHWDYDGLMSSFDAMPVCRQDTKLVIIILSAMDNVAERTAIRETWCSFQSQLAYQCVFLLGHGPHNSSIEDEVQHYGDILRAGYEDTYRNLSLKVLTGLHWTAHHCQTPYILKTDDDCFVNIQIMMKFLPYQQSDLASLYVGNILTGRHTEVVRNPESKWHVSKDQYAPESYPPYPSGAGYVLSKKVISGILEASQSHEPFPNEDAYVGVIAQYLDISPVQSYRFTLISSKWTLCNFMYLFVIHQVSPAKLRTMQRTANSALLTCGENQLISTWT